jgi:preprotein translocase subunit SecD
MERKARRNLIIILILTVASLWLALPSIFPEPPGFLAPILLQKRMRLGLDLKGGMHLVLSVQTEEAVKNRIVEMRHRLNRWAEEQKVPEIQIADRDPYELAITVPSGALARLDEFMKRYEDQWEVTGKIQSSESGEIRIRLLSREIQHIRDSAVRQSIETLRNRIDQFGIVEPSIQRQGDDRITIQLPGIQDPSRALALIGRTAQLNFHLVRDDLFTPGLREHVQKVLDENPQLKNDLHALDATLSTALPPGTMIRFERVGERLGSYQVPILLDRDPVLSGDTIADARVRVDSQYNQPYVALEFNREGSERFDQITARNVKKRLAIVLDDIVYSAPVIQERISGGLASITGSFTMDEARDLAIILRAGALPAPVKIEEQRVVGPSLGQDSIRQGVYASFAGALLVFLFMLIYYRYAGFVANVSLVVNVLMILAILTLFEATMTLPGIAGIALTIGMAVDGNIIVYERIREEILAGKGPRSAVEAGFSRAFSTIMDANLTTLLAGAILFQFGTGPIRGFALTLSLGILTTLFTVLYVSRALMELYIARRGVRTLSI